ncbi:hypothetical protein NDU88_002406 [Pleurodeles waltl]|uniref:Uncharacterized protein n=1 Tax=Pleurodeles waltl TaxID=8319 RepID=A0AAV7VCR9_PLEWA|nr:hypothetical protein NDU88_002406 [Pleurodeles waltl]
MKNENGPWSFLHSRCPIAPRSSRAAAAARDTLRTAFIFLGAGAAGLSHGSAHSLFFSTARNSAFCPCAARTPAALRARSIRLWGGGGAQGNFFWGTGNPALGASQRFTYFRHRSLWQRCGKL